MNASGARTAARPGSLLGAIVALLLVLHSAPGAAAVANGQDDKLRLFSWRAPSSLNPYLAEGPQDLAASRIVYEPLASINGRGRLVPFLAAEIPSWENGGLAADGRSVIWRLKPDVTWADGMPFTASDVVFTYHYVLYSPVTPASSAAFDEVERVEALDDQQVKITFTKANAAWRKVFVGPNGMILPRHLFAPYIGGAAKDAPVNRIATGTGPYRSVSFQDQDVIVIDDQVIAGGKIIFEPNPTFREPGKPAFKVIELQSGDGERRWAAQAAEEGLTDFAWDLAEDPLTLKRLNSGAGGTIARSGSWIESLPLVVTGIPLEQIRESSEVPLLGPRQAPSEELLANAIARAIDYQAILELYQEAGIETARRPGWYPEGLASGGEPGFDVKGAAALLAEAGWLDRNGDGWRDRAGTTLSLRFRAPRDPIQRAATAQITSSLRALGLWVGDDFLDPGAYLRIIGAQGASAPWPSSLPPPNKPEPLSGVTAWHQPASLSDERSGAALNIPLVRHRQSAAVNKKLGGVIFTPWDLPFWNIKDWHLR